MFKRNTSIIDKSQELSIDTKKKLARLLVHIGEAEARAEFARQTLCKTQDFELVEAFKRIDKESTGELSCNEISLFMR